MRQFQGMDPRAVTLFQNLKQQYPGISFSSGYRSPSHNARVGGSKRSQHLGGRAFDINVPSKWRTKELSEFAQAARSAGATSGGYYGLTPNVGHAMHFDVRDGQAIWGHDRTRKTAPQWLTAAMQGKPGPTTHQPSLVAGPTDVSSAGSSAAPVPVRAGEGQALATAGAGAHTVPAVTSNQGGNTLEQKKPRSLMGGLLQGINSPGFLAGAVMLDSAARGGGIAQGAQMLQQSRSREEDLAYRKQRNEIADQYRQKTMEMQQQRMAQAGQPKTPWWATQNGVDPRMLQYRQAGRPQTTNNVNVAGTKMESSFDKEVGKQYAKYYMAGQKGADTSRTALRNLEVMESALQDPNVYQGSGGETIQGLKKAAQTLFGVPVKGVGTGELIQRMAKKGALDMKGDLPGPLSNSDRDYLDSMQAGLGKSPEGNRQIVRMSMLQKKYHIARAQAARDFAAQNKGRFDQTKFGPFLEKIEGEYAQRFSQLIGQMRSEGEVPPRSPMAGIPTLRSAQEFMALPSGARFKAPDGSIRIKP